MRLIPFYALIALVLVPGVGEASLIIDGDFSNWTYSSTIVNVFNPSAMVTRESNNGNPGARLAVTTHTRYGNFTGYPNLDTAFGNAIKDDIYTTGALSGLSFTFSLDVLQGRGDFGQGQFLYLLVEQRGRIYGEALNVTGVHPQFTTMTYHGTFNAGAFKEFRPNGFDTSKHPDLTGNTITYFGFAAGNSISGDLTQYFDNYRLEIPGLHSLTPAPEPSSAMLAGMGACAMLLGWCRRRFAARS